MTNRELAQNKVAESLRIVADNMPEGYPSEREILRRAVEEIYRLEAVEHGEQERNDE